VMQSLGEGNTEEIQRIALVCLHRWRDASVEMINKVYL